ncbi:MAG: hypothetical protein J0I81_05885, partial [Hyphomicrobium sp.]|nr:hypothetical protein [Hyphomicrobium sp.]
QGRPNCILLAVEAPSEPATDHFGTVNMSNPEVPVLLDSDPSIVRDQERAERFRSIALKPRTVDGQTMIPKII